VRRRDARGVGNGGRGFESVSVAWPLRGTGHRALFVRGQVAPARDLLEEEGRRDLLEEEGRKCTGAGAGAGVGADAGTAGGGEEEGRECREHRGELFM
jgi:hypothetical protein